MQFINVYLVVINRNGKLLYLEKDEPVIVQPTLEDLLRPEAEEEEPLSLADFDDEQ